MNESLQQPTEDSPADPRQISKWTRTYAQNRSLGVVVNTLLFVLLSLAIGLPSYWGGIAYRSGNMLLFWLCIAAVVPAVIAVAYFSVPRWGGQRIEEIIRRLYASEGEVTVSALPTKRAKWPLELLAGYLHGLHTWHRCTRPSRVSAGSSKIFAADLRNLYRAFLDCALVFDATDCGSYRLAVAGALRPARDSDRCWRNRLFSHRSVERAEHADPDCRLRHPHRADWACL